MATATAIRATPTAENSLWKANEAAKNLRLHIAALLRDGDTEPTEDDLKALQDTFDGETTLEAELRNALIEIDEAEIIAEGCNGRITIHAERKARAQKRIGRIRGLIEQSMLIAEWPKQVLDIGTISVATGKPCVKVTDEAAVQATYFVKPDPVIDMAAVKTVMLARHKAIEIANTIKDDAAREDELTRIAREMPVVLGTHVEDGCTVLTIRRR